MNFVGIKLKEGTPLSQNIDEGIIFQITNFALLNPGDGVTQVFVETEGDSYLVATLSAAHPQYLTDVAVSDQEVTLSVKGRGEVHVTGTFSLDSAMMSDSEMDDSDLMAEYPSGSDSEGGDADHPAFAGTKRVELLEEDGGSDSSDSNLEKQQQQQHQKKQAAPQGQKPQQQGAQKPQQPQGQKPPQQGQKPAAAGAAAHGHNNAGKPQQGKPQQGKPQGGQAKPIQQGKPAPVAPAAQPGGANPFQPAGGKKKKRKNKGGNAGGQEGGEKKAKN